MLKSVLKPLVPHLYAILIFIGITYIYFSPLLENKKLNLQSDVVNFNGMAKELIDYRDETGKEALWTNSMFSGMPGYLISTVHPGNLIIKVTRTLIPFGKPAGYLFLYLVGFYILLIAFRVNPWLSVVGAIGFAFSSYFFIIIAVGHLSKAWAIGYMAPIIAGVYLAYRDRVLLGAVIMGIFLSVQLYVNHLQITYYTFIIILIFGIYELVRHIRQKTYMQFLKPLLALFVALALAVLTNLGSIWTTYEYSKESMRGKSELTLGQEEEASGMDKEYATRWSYGVGETMTLLIPNFMGGASTGELGENSNTYDVLNQEYGPQNAKLAIKQLPLYWGPQYFTEGPVYIGAILIFLFVLGLFVLKGPEKWWILTATILSILLAWGKHFMWLTNLFIDYFPGFDKFRVPSMILVIAEFCVPLMGILAIKNIVENNVDKQQLIKGLKYSLYIVGGISLFFALLPGAFASFSGPRDVEYENTWIPMAELMMDRQKLLQADAFRSLIFILLAAGVLYFFIQKKIKPIIFYLALGGLILIDLMPVDKRYLNNDDFVRKTAQSQNPFTPSPADQQILQDPDLYYRVYEATPNAFQSSRTSYFHKSIGGYHGAKMKRYNELITYQISQNNMNVINMLNVKYFIINGEKGPSPNLNPNALGNAWNVRDFRIVENADEEMEALLEFNPASEAIIDKRFRSHIPEGSLRYDSLASIDLVGYAPNQLNYLSRAASPQLVVFSDIYYQPGWQAFINGEKADHFRVNYVLRGMVLPEGENEIEFTFEPASFYMGNRIGMAGSLILWGIFLFVAYTWVRSWISSPEPD